MLPRGGGGQALSHVVRGRRKKKKNRQSGQSDLNVDLLFEYGVSNLESVGFPTIQEVFYFFI